MNTKTKQKKYSFKGKVWKHKGKGGWYFITLPQGPSRKIRVNHGLDEEGWGRLKTSAKVGRSEWKTAIWYDSKSNAYLLPVKTLIRKMEKVEMKSKVAVSIVFEDSGGIKNQHSFRGKNLQIF